MINYVQKNNFFCFGNTVFFSCKGQDKDKVATIEDNHLIGKEFIIDQYNYKNDLFNSKKLDALFKKDNYSNLIGEYSGTSKENFDCKIIGLFRNNRHEKSNALFYDKNEILRDTLKLPIKIFHLMFYLKIIKKESL